MAHQLVSLLRGLDERVPRYTSYPTADRFDRAIGEAHYLKAARDSNRLPLPPSLSIYVHIPFCHSLCYYCGCNKVVTRRHEKSTEYLAALTHEVAWQSQLFDDDRTVDQIHLGGGTPTFLNDFELHRLRTTLDRHFRLSNDDGREFSIEIDPRTVDPDRIGHLADLGFNRYSLGIQDFDFKVQQAINRIQPFADVARVVDAIRNESVAISFDLIYGLPFQTAVGFARTVERTIELGPDRIAMYRYAHLPQRFRSQRLLEDHRPGVHERLTMFAEARDALIDAGYVAIGLDHFALPSDELAIAWQDGSLQRNFQGYSTRGGRDLIALGPSAISSVGDCFVQNEPNYPIWRDGAPNPPNFVRGFVCSQDDRLRGSIIEQIMCCGEIDLAEITGRTGQQWDEYFERELNDLSKLCARDLVTIDGSRIAATPSGILALRQIASVFDSYLRSARANRPSGPDRYSEAI